MKQVKISRRSFLLGLGVVSSAALLAACGDSSSSAASSSEPTSSEPASSSAASSEVPVEPILEISDFPRTDGSTACIPLIAQIMADTTGMDLETAQGCVNTNKTSWAWRNLALYSGSDGGAKLIIAYEPSESVKKELETDGVPLEQKAIGRDAPAVRLCSRNC